MKQKQLDRVYSNKEMLSTLGVSDKLLIQYRNDGVLPYRRMDDKYWYTQEDLDYFMNTHKVGVPFASWTQVSIKRHNALYTDNCSIEGIIHLIDTVLGEAERCCFTLVFIRSEPQTDYSINYTRLMTCFV